MNLMVGLAHKTNHRGYVVYDDSFSLDMYIVHV